MAVTILLPPGATFGPSVSARAVDAAASTGSLLLLDFSRSDCLTTESASASPVNLVAAQAAAVVGASVPGTDAPVDASAGRVSAGGGLALRTGVGDELRFGLPLAAHAQATQNDVAVSFWLRSYLVDAVDPAQTTANHKVLSWGTSPFTEGFLYRYQVTAGNAFPSVLNGFDGALVQPPNLNALVTGTALHHVVVSSTEAWLDGVRVAQEARVTFPAIDESIQVGPTTADANLPADWARVYRVHVEDLTASGRTVTEHVAAERALVTGYHPMWSAE